MINRIPYVTNVEWLYIWPIIVPSWNGHIGITHVLHVPTCTERADMASFVKSRQAALVVLALVGVVRLDVLVVFALQLLDSFLHCPAVSGQCVHVDIMYMYIDSFNNNIRYL